MAPPRISLNDSTPEEWGAFVRREMAKRGKVARDAGLQADLWNIRPPRVFTVFACMGTHQFVYPVTQPIVTIN